MSNILRVQSGLLAEPFRPPAVAELNPADKGSAITLDSMNLGAVSASAAVVRSVTSVASGKYYFEVTFRTISNTNTVGPGIASASFNNTNAPGLDGGSQSIACYDSHNLFLGGGSPGPWAASSPSNGDVAGFAIDLDNMRWWGIGLTFDNHHWNGNGANDPTTDVGGLDISALSGSPFFATLGFHGGGGSALINFGAGGFTGFEPSGFGNWPG